jgi:starch phosphorylase
MAAAGAGAEEIARTQARLAPGVLTLGFARRFATYKRPNLLLHDPERLIRILKDPKRPAQLILAGKAHPADQAGQALIQEWTRFIRRSDASPPVVFLADYDMLIAERLVQGVDVWVNTPRRPWEASGTSGMKVLVNGGINLSELDGWWAEAYNPQVGWALGDGGEHGENSDWDAAEAEALYERLEREVIPEFYSRNEKGIPIEWVARIRESMARLTPQFSASRSVREYTEQFYLPAGAAFRERAANQGEMSGQIAAWRRTVDEKWGLLRFGSLQVETTADRRVFEIELFLNGLDPDAVRVELYADGIAGGEPVREEMKRAKSQLEASGCCVYRATVPAARPAGDYTARATPRRAGLAVPLEEDRILWQR